ncbi:MAG TPA: hypothetical protein VIG30_08720, partial [Ktedonobacterales bacterium]
MEIHTRVGLVAGVGGFVLLAMAQPLVGVAAVVLALVVGLAAGLGTAKWLPRAWYGRQIVAGAQAGLLACGVALAGFLLSLIVAGAHATATLAARSHLPGIDLGPLVRGLGAVGWLGAGFVLALLAWAAGTGVAALAGQFGAWDKNQHAIEVVARARAAAQHTGRLATVAPRTAPHLLGTLPPVFAAPLTPPVVPPVALPGAPPPGARAAPAFPVAPLPPEALNPGGDLAGLNESWYSLRSPVNVFPPPDTPERPWSRYDERLPPGALLPDEFAMDADAEAAASNASDTTAGAAPAPQDGTAWRADAGWMDYED